MIREIDLSRFARFRLLDDEPTPIHPLDSLSSRLAEEGHHVRIFVKRDDLIPIGGGGNKLRKLEFILGEAIAAGADTILTFGGRQSNHARQTAAAAAKAGLACELFLSRVVPRDDTDYVWNGNVLLDALFGAKVHDLPADADAKAFAAKRMRMLAADGRRPYLCPTGGSSPLGCLGYVGCASEIALQSHYGDIGFSQVIVPNGSHGTHAGLAAGFAALGRDPKLVKSYSVLAPLDEARRGTLAEAQATAALLDHPGRALMLDDIVVDDAHRGEGYGIPTKGMREALQLVARSEGLLLDPVYSGKAFAGLLHDIRSGAYPDGRSVLFVMTGGTPGLFAYRSALA